MDQRLTIKDLPREDRPRERLWRYGPQAISNAELLAILLRTGHRHETAIQLAHRLLKMGEAKRRVPGGGEGGNGFRYLLGMSLEELGRVKGMGPAKASQIKAAAELGRRLAAGVDRLPVVKGPRDAADLMMEEMRYLDREHFRIVLLDTKNHVIGTELVSVGGLSSSLVHPREIFKEAIRRSAAAIILVHNHPSGDPTPSTEDIEITRRLREAGQLLGIDVLDHVIIGEKRYTSFREKGLE